MRERAKFGNKIFTTKHTKDRKFGKEGFTNFFSFLHDLRAFVVKEFSESRST